MLATKARHRLCYSCSSHVLNSFLSSFGLRCNAAKHGGNRLTGKGLLPVNPPKSRYFSNGRQLRNATETEMPSEFHLEQIKTPEQMEAVVRQARQAFGETLPRDFLSPQEYQIYERLYGPPSGITADEDIGLLAGIEFEEDMEEAPRDVLMREGKDGKLEEIEYEEEEDVDMVEEVGENGEFAEDLVDDIAIGEENSESGIGSESLEEFQSRVEALRVAAAARTSKAKATAPQDDLEEDEVFEEMVEGSEGGEAASTEHETADWEEILENDEQAYSGGEFVRAHPLTAVGRFGTSPSTIQIPKDTVVDPTTALLADASNKHISEAAHKAFGGKGLPNSTATIKRPNLKQEPLGLEASQYQMGEMEGNAFVTAIMPGAYASIFSTLVEVRKRLGSQWLHGLMHQPGGPRILDAGAGGAGVLAWREILRAEWGAADKGDLTEDAKVPYGKSTVVTGSAVLRHKASRLLDNTTFIPRLPDYDPSRDHPSLESSNPQPRKQYDIIVAPHTLWSLKEDYMRKSQIQNFWSLLDPRGGVLILIEKGVPRGFELIAGARETLLKHHISSPGSEELIQPIEDGNETRFGPKEKGMIIAPCTSHGKCPMYITAGESQRRKDFCHFSQRFIRPPYLQRILKARDSNHEDVRYSYVALQRGVDQRQEQNFEQGHKATERAFAGYETAVDKDAEVHNADAISPSTLPNPFTFPRAILPPIKRTGHVTLDLCTPAGKIERWTVPKSFSRQAYRDARKSKWGDLWALGAKTRVQRNIRVGFRKSKSPSIGEDADAFDDGPDEEQPGVDRGFEGGDEVPKRQQKARRARKQKKKMKVLENDAAEDI